MIIKVKRVDGITELRETNEYLICQRKDLNPLFLKAEVFTDTGKRVACIKRRFQFIYKHFIFTNDRLEEELRKQFPPQQGTVTDTEDK